MVSLYVYRDLGLQLTLLAAVKWFLPSRVTRGLRRVSCVDHRNDGASHGCRGEGAAWMFLDRRAGLPTRQQTSRS